MIEKKNGIGKPTQVEDTDWVTDYEAHINSHQVYKIYQTSVFLNRISVYLEIFVYLQQLCNCFGDSLCVEEWKRVQNIMAYLGSAAKLGSEMVFL